MAGGASRTDGVLWGSFLWLRLDSRPPKRLTAAVGRWELFGWVRHVPVSSCGSDDEFWADLTPLHLSVSMHAS